MNSYLIGIDGGASRSTAILVEASNELVSTEPGPGLNPLSIDAEGFNARITALLATLLADHQVSDVKGLCAGLAGTGNETVRLKTIAAIKQAAGIENVHVISDALAALWGAFQGKPGLLLIAGTGSICLGLDEQGKTARAGGFGRILGDEGSGYWISVAAIRRALWEVDGRGSSSTLQDIINKHFNLQDIRELIPLMHDDKLTSDKIASLAAVLLPHSETEAVICDVIDRAASHLAGLVSAAAMKLGFKEPAVALWGGLWKSSGQEMQKALQRELSARELSVKIVEPAESPEWGAVRYLQNLSSKASE